eukprot:5084371-Amphidinium_carterae.1
MLLLRRLPLRAVRRADANLLHSGISHWQVAPGVYKTPLATEVGQSLAVDGDCADYDVVFQKVLSDTLPGKSTSTLLNRVGPFIRFADWAREAEQEPFLYMEPAFIVSWMLFVAR